jgi:hypothetical protein
VLERVVVRVVVRVVERATVVLEVERMAVIVVETTLALEMIVAKMLAKMTMENDGLYTLMLPRTTTFY